MQYLLDTVVMIRHFSGKGKIGREASRILNNIELGDDSIIVSIISIMEVMYLAEKHRISISLEDTFNNINSSSRYAVVDLSAEILRVAETIIYKELHDRLILATAKWLDIKVISSDNGFNNVKGIEVVWD